MSLCHRQCWAVGHGGRRVPQGFLSLRGLQRHLCTLAHTHSCLLPARRERVRPYARGWPLAPHGPPCAPVHGTRWRHTGARWWRSHGQPRVTHAVTSGTLSSRPRLRSGAVARRSPATPTPPPTAFAVHPPAPRSVAYAAIGRRATVRSTG